MASKNEWERKDYPCRECLGKRKEVYVDGDGVIVCSVYKRCPAYRSWMTARWSKVTETVRKHMKPETVARWWKRG